MSEQDASVVCGKCLDPERCVDCAYKRMMHALDNRSTDAKPWHQVLADWAPKHDTGLSFFGTERTEPEIVAGDVGRFIAALERAGVKLAKRETSVPGFAAFDGIKVVACNVLPKDKAYLIDARGNIVAAFDVPAAP